MDDELAEKVAQFVILVYHRKTPVDAFVQAGLGPRPAGDGEGRAT
jgi:hypothetical protein